MAALRVQDNTFDWLAGWLAACPSAPQPFVQQAQRCFVLVRCSSLPSHWLHCSCFYSAKKGKKKTTKITSIEWLGSSAHSRRICMLDVEFFLDLFSFLPFNTFNFFRFCSTPHLFRIYIYIYIKRPSFARIHISCSDLHTVCMRALIVVVVASIVCDHTAVIDPHIYNTNIISSPYHTAWHTLCRAATICAHHLPKSALLLY